MAPPEPPEGCPRPAGATADPPSLAPDPGLDQPAENGAHMVQGKLAGKPQDEPAGSLSLWRYLSNPAAYEMRALGLPAAKSPLVTSDIGSHKAASTSASQSAVDTHGPVPKSGEPCPLPLASVPEGVIEAATSISLSPSPPACPSSEEDAAKHHDLRGVAAWRRGRNAKVERRKFRIRKRVRNAKKDEKKP